MKVGIIGLGYGRVVDAAELVLDLRGVTRGDEASSLVRLQAA